MAKPKTKAVSERAVKTNAAQKLKTLEEALTSNNQKFEILADEIDKLSNLLVNLNKKVNAILEAGEGGNINKDSVSSILVDNAISDLKKRTEELVRLGAMELVDGTIENERYFIVAREVDAEGNVVNPRTQFAIIALPKDIQAAFIGKKAGEIISLNESSPSIEVLEVYKLASVSDDTQDKAE